MQAFEEADVAPLYEGQWTELAYAILVRYRERRGDSHCEKAFRVACMCGTHSFFRTDRAVGEWTPEETKTVTCVHCRAIFFVKKTCVGIENDGLPIYDFVQLVKAPQRTPEGRYR